MLTITSHNNTYLRPGQRTMQAVFSVHVDAYGAVTPTALKLGIAIDHSTSMKGEKMGAARDGAVKVVQSLDETMAFMAVAFSHEADIIFGPAMGTPANKTRAAQALQRVIANGGTRMSVALNTIVEAFGNDPGWSSRILFLTDGRNEGESRAELDKAVARCAEANIIIDAWGIGVDWDARELRHIADQTRGTAGIIPKPNMVAASFADSMQHMRQTALTNVRLALWSPAGVTIKGIQQVYPNLVPLTLQPDRANPRLQIAALGALAADEQRDYLLDLELPPSTPGQQFVVARPSIRYVAAGGQEQEEKSTRDGWVFAQWTENEALAIPIDRKVAHYTRQEELARYVQEGQEALAANDYARATQKLTLALNLAETTGNTQMVEVLGNIVHRDSNGTVTLNKQATAVDKQTLAIKTGRTARIN